VIYDHKYRMVYKKNVLNVDAELQNTSTELYQTKYIFSFIDMYTQIHMDTSYFNEIFNKVVLHVKMQKKLQSI